MKKKSLRKVRLSHLSDEFDHEIECKDKDKRCSLKQIVKDEAFASYILYNGKGCVHYKRGDKMGKSSRYGTVYYTCCNDSGRPKDCGHITKIVKFGRSSTTTMFHQEVMIQQMAAKKKIAPPIAKAYISSKQGVVVMKKLDQTLLDYIASFLRTSPSPAAIGQRAKKIALQFCKLIFRLHKLGIAHGDLHVNNIMFEKQRMYFIDYGKATIRPITRGYRFNYEYRLLDDYQDWKVFANSIHYLKNTGTITDANIRLFYDAYFQSIRDEKAKEEKNLKQPAFGALPDE